MVDNLRYWLANRSARLSAGEGWSRCPGSNWRPRPYQGRALPTELHRPSRLMPLSRRFGRQVGRTSPSQQGVRLPTGSRPIREAASPTELAFGERRLERETGIEPATNSLEGCDSTTELLPPRAHSLALALRRASPPRSFRSDAPACRRSCSRPAGIRHGLPTEARPRVRRERRVVAREGLEPSKPLGRQIYSLLRLTASLPRQLLCFWKPCFRRATCGPDAPSMELAKGFEPPTG